jgi:redox-sensitive bicupin YhaK (pirin superfamily)
MEPTILSRSVVRTVTAPPPAPGFLGAGHTAVEVLTDTSLVDADPFIFLMDDRVDLDHRRQLGGAHPHAGIETVTLVVEGTVHDRHEGTLEAGDAVWMNSGRGVIHNEHVEAEGFVRILQLWVRLPAGDRGAAPDLQHIRRETMPVRREDGVEVRLYSGTSGALRSATRNRAPVTLADVRLRPGAAVEQDLPSSYNGFFYVLDGTVAVGEARLRAGQVGWLDRPEPGAGSIVRFRAPEGPARLVLYAGEPQREPLVHHGPFVAGSQDDIVRLFREFRSARFTPLSRLAAEPRARH